MLTFKTSFWFKITISICECVLSIYKWLFCCRKTGIKWWYTCNMISDIQKILKIFGLFY